VLSIPAPAALHGDALTAELHAAGFTGAEVTLVGDRLEVSGVSESDRAKVEQVAGRHAPLPPPADPADEFRKAVESSTTLAGLKAALLGTTGPGAEPRRPEAR
jgi:hypothetical protein